MHKDSEDAGTDPMSSRMHKDSEDAGTDPMSSQTPCPQGNEDERTVPVSSELSLWKQEER